MTESAFTDVYTLPHVRLSVCLLLHPSPGSGLDAEDGAAGLSLRRSRRALRAVAAAAAAAPATVTADFGDAFFRRHPPGDSGDNKLTVPSSAGRKRAACFCRALASSLLNPKPFIPPTCPIRVAPSVSLLAAAELRYLGLEVRISHLMVGESSAEAGRRMQIGGKMQANRFKERSWARGREAKRFLCGRGRRTRVTNKSKN